MTFRRRGSVRAPMWCPLAESDFDGALRFQAVSQYLDSRSRGHEALRHHGALTLDLLPQQLPVALVNQYLTIKASGSL